MKFFKLNKNQFQCFISLLTECIIGLIFFTIFEIVVLGAYFLIGG